MEYWESIAKIFQSLITSLALLIGGIWAYFKFLRGRIYKPRMELNVECQIYLQKNNLVRLHVRVILKNVGLSRVNINRENSAVRIYRVHDLEYVDLIPDGALKLEWCRIGTFSIFDEHQWIEPSEIIDDQIMINCQSIDPIFKIEATVMSETQQWCSSYISMG